MANIDHTIRNRFLLANRYKNFGATLRNTRIVGFRGISDLSLEFAHPVTAISGLNGSGKSTLGQIAACGYKLPSTAGADKKRYHLPDFFPVSIADPEPFTSNASVRFTYETTDPSKPQEVTVTRQSSKWSGYKRQPERFCHYIGLTFYLPKVERRDLSIYRVQGLEFRSKRVPDNDVREKVAEILKQSYDDIHFQTVGHKTKESELGIVRRYGRQYSENNMGFGEGRILYLVDEMEGAANQSLFVLEELETSLHEDARHRLARYFLDVCVRKGHQIIFSTHSSEMLQALSAESRILLTRDQSGVAAYPSISTAQVRGLLSDGKSKGLNICVEDSFSRQIIVEMIRRAEPLLLKAVAIVEIGDAHAVVQAVRIARQMGQNAIAVRDADQRVTENDGIYALPGLLAPEKEAFASVQVRDHLKVRFNIDLEAFLSTMPSVAHHEIAERLANDLCLDRGVLVGEVTRAYADGLEPAKVAALLWKIKQHLR